MDYHIDGASKTDCKIKKKIVFHNVSLHHNLRQFPKIIFMIFVVNLKKVMRNDSFFMGTDAQSLKILQTSALEKFGSCWIKINYSCIVILEAEFKYDAY